jgi:hypothetical protein
LWFQQLVQESELVLVLVLVLVLGLGLESALESALEQAQVQVLELLLTEQKLDQGE